jgi:hypothetical protein
VFPVRRASKLAQDALPFRFSVLGQRASAVATIQGPEPVDVEAGDYGGHGVARPPPGPSGSCNQWQPIGDGEHRLRPGHPIGAFTAGPADALQFIPFVRR